MKLKILIRGVTSLKCGVILGGGAEIHDPVQVLRLCWGLQNLFFTVDEASNGGQEHSVREGSLEFYQLWSTSRESGRQKALPQSI